MHAAGVPGGREGAGTVLPSVEWADHGGWACCWASSNQAQLCCQQRPSSAYLLPVRSFPLSRCLTALVHQPISSPRPAPPSRDASQPFYINLLDVSVGASFHRCVYLLAAKDEPLGEAYDTACDAAGLDPSPPFMPHLSLLYSDIDQVGARGGVLQPDSLQQPLDVGARLALSCAIHAWVTESSKLRVVGAHTGACWSAAPARHVAVAVRKQRGPRWRRSGSAPAHACLASAHAFLASACITWQEGRTAAAREATARLYGEAAGYDTLMREPGFMVTSLSLWYTPIDDYTCASWKLVEEVPLTGQ
jgi:hypothetical protein